MTHRATNPRLALILSTALIIILIAIIELYPKATHLARTNCEQTTVTLPDGATITAQIADSTAERAKGLSDRPSLPPNTGMLFVFPAAGHHSFWMYRTLIPLDIIWIRNNRVVDVASLQPATSSTIPQHTPTEDADTVLEVNQGIASQHGVVAGETISWTPCY